MIRGRSPQNGSANRFVAEGSACSPGGAPLKSILVVQKGRGQIQGELPPGELSFGSRKFSWLAIDSLFKDGDEWVVSLLNGERFAGKPAGLPSVRFGAGRTTQLATADRIEMRLENGPPHRGRYEIRAHRGPKVFAPMSRPASDQRIADGADAELRSADRPDADPASRS